MHQNHLEDWRLSVSYQESQHDYVYKFSEMVVM